MSICIIPLIVKTKWNKIVSHKTSRPQKDNIDKPLYIHYSLYKRNDVHYKRCVKYGKLLMFSHQKWRF